MHELTNGRVWKTQNGMHIENEVIGLMKKGLAKKVRRLHAPGAVNISLPATVKADGGHRIGLELLEENDGTIEDSEMRRRSRVRA